MWHLLISVAESSARLLDADFAEYLTGQETGGEQIDEEVFCIFCSFAVCANQNELSVKCEDRSRPVTGRIGVRNTAANGALVSHLHVANASCAVRQQRTDRFQQIRRFQ